MWTKYTPLLLESKSTDAKTCIKNAGQSLNFTTHDPVRVIIDRLSPAKKKKIHIFEKKKKKKLSTDFQSCYIVTTFCLRTLIKCSGVKSTVV